MTRWRLINSGTQNPYYNMALDEALFMSYKFSRQPVLRIYSWQPPAFSFGLFQGILGVLDIDSCRNEGVSFVRRITGGGILFHDRELTYSIICSKYDLRANYTVKESFKVLCSFIMDFYQRLGLAPRFSYEVNTSFVKGSSSFCLSSLEDYDIIIDNKKIGGNAQKRKKEVILQHGSIPLSLDLEIVKGLLREDLSCVEGKTTSLNRLLNREPDFEEILRMLIDSFEYSFCCRLEESMLTSDEEESARFLEEAKYKTAEWNIYRKEPTFSYNLK